jgi:hypothetical protein
MSADPSTVDNIESSANITLTVDGIEVPIAELDTQKEVEMTQHRQNSLKANGVSIESIDYSGSASFKGDRISGPDGRRRLDDLIYADDGTPVPVTITIYHDLEGDSDEYQDVFFVSDGYNSSNESETETSYDWIAMRKGGE